MPHGIFPRGVLFFVRRDLKWRKTPPPPKAGGPAKCQFILSERTPIVIHNEGRVRFLAPLEHRRHIHVRQRETNPFFAMNCLRGELGAQEPLVNQIYQQVLLAVVHHGNADEFVQFLRGFFGMRIQVVVLCN